MRSGLIVFGTWIFFRSCGLHRPTQLFAIGRSGRWVLGYGGYSRRAAERVGPNLENRVRFILLDKKTKQRRLTAEIDSHSVCHNWLKRCDAVKRPTLRFAPTLVKKPLQQLRIRRLGIAVYHIHVADP